MPKANYRLIDSHIIAATPRDECTGHDRESRLDLDYCLQTSPHDHAYYEAAMAPKSFDRPHLEHTMAVRWKVPDEVKTGENQEWLKDDGHALHIRKEIWIPIFPNIDLDKYIRVTKSGRLDICGWEHAGEAWIVRGVWLVLKGGDCEEYLDGDNQVVVCSVDALHHAGKTVQKGMRRFAAGGW